MSIELVSLIRLPFAKCWTSLQWERDNSCIYSPNTSEKKIRSLINTILRMREQRAGSAEQFRPVSVVDSNSTSPRFQTVSYAEKHSLSWFFFNTALNTPARNEGPLCSCWPPCSLIQSFFSGGWQGLRELRRGTRWWVSDNNMKFLAHSRCAGGRYLSQFRESIKLCAK